MEEIETRVTEVLGHYQNLRLAILFGSQITGEASPASDIDLGLLAESPLSAAFKLELMQKIGAACGRPVDIVDLSIAGEPILGEVFKGRRLLGDASTYAQLLSRHLIDSSDFLPLHRRILAERREAWMRS
ncbi:type VII toxin-antitoxin system MntA family adenylyltransferase antitoxin [Chromatocurvus halotolerans]|uniref:Nucleotidyltransferase-like protein n=1 Tax=Chromatocurvus halotolerans TaxID=1132028 RepID=A0A4R2KTQ8_9GAMM|nr:nucleotidyltransferase domain-containing protein [Chromatocurvus halotolerans]TCO74486.1 nucleotidyltransferase-like protein [Chromatocurvus halotolerans]